jgi:hypothetical protein
MPKNELPKFLPGRKHQMIMGHIDELIYRPLRPLVHIFFPTGRAKTFLEGKGQFFFLPQCGQKYSPSPLESSRQESIV